MISLPELYRISIIWLDTNVALLLPIVIGACIGFTAGMFGIGGALMATPLLKLFMGMPELLALATPLVATIPAAVSGSVAYHRQGLLRLDVARYVLVTALPFNIGGAFLTAIIPGGVLMVCTGIVLAYSALIFIQKGWKKGKVGAEQSPEIISPPMLYLTGALAGFMSGFLAIGGGIVLVPAFVKIGKLPTKQALATSLLCIAALAVPGVATHAYLGHIDWQVALVLCTTVVPLSYLGARVAGLLRNVVLERIYGTVMLAFAIFFTLKNL